MRAQRLAAFLIVAHLFCLTGCATREPVRSMQIDEGTFHLLQENAAGGWSKVGEVRSNSGSAEFDMDGFRRPGSDRGNGKLETKLRFVYMGKHSREESEARFIKHEIQNWNHLAGILQRGAQSGRPDRLIAPGWYQLQQRARGEYTHLVDAGFCWAGDSVVVWFLSTRAEHVVGYPLRLVFRRPSKHNGSEVFHFDRIDSRGMTRDLYERVEEREHGVYVYELQ